MKVEKLKNISKIVKEILEQDERAREDDAYLIFLVVQKINPEMAGSMFRDVMFNAKSKGISFESIRRCRQKVQEQNPELRPSEKLLEARNETEAVYRDFAVGIEENMNHIPRID